MIKIAINGFGRIGRQTLKFALERENIEVVAVNDLAPADISAHLLMFDSVYGIYPYPVSVEVNGEIIDREGIGSLKEHIVIKPEDNVFLVVKDKKIKLLSNPEPENLPWEELSIDVVLECTGRFEKDGLARAHNKAGAKTIISAPAKGTGDDGTFLIGVNADTYKGEELVSNGSCTTNCVAPVTSVLKEIFGIKKALMTTIHAYTASQNLVDGYSKAAGDDLRRSRAAANNLVATTTGAAISTTKVIPELDSKFDGLSVRVPVICGSLTDFTFVLEKQTTVEDVNKAFIDAANSARYKGILQVTNEAIVSSDIIGNTSSAIVDLSLTKVVDGDLVKVMAWYDNEAGYSSRLLDLAEKIGNYE